MPSIMALASLYCGITIKESFIAATFNAAKAINRSNSIGLLDEGYKADILIWDINNLNEIPYWFNSDRIESVLKNGKLIFKNNIH
jgi:imidazolonepropionase